MAICTLATLKNTMYKQKANSRPKKRKRNHLLELTAIYKWTHSQDLPEIRVAQAPALPRLTSRAGLATPSIPPPNHPAVTPPSNLPVNIASPAVQTAGLWAVILYVRGELLRLFCMLCVPCDEWYVGDFVYWDAFTLMVWVEVLHVQRRCFLDRPACYSVCFWVVLLFSCCT